MIAWLRRNLLKIVLRVALVGVPWTSLGAVAIALYAASRARPSRDSAEMPVPPPDLPLGRIMAVPGVGELFVRDTDPAAPSDKPVVVLLHGWLVPSDPNWYTAYGPLSEIARVIAIDHRGHGRGLRPGVPFRLSDVADDLAALLHHLGTPPVVVVGYSMGGPIAQLTWQRHPEVVAGLVLCATSATFNVTRRDRSTWRLTGAFQLGLRLVPRHWWEGIIEWQARGGPFSVTRLVGADTPEELRALLPWILSEVDRGSAEDVAEAGRELARYDARGWIGTLDVPSAVVITTRDSLVPLRNQQDLVRRLPDPEVFEVALDHNAAAASPATFVPALVDAVQAVLKRGAEG